MDVIIPYMYGYEPDLKYSLRSLEKFGPQVGKVFIVGEKLPPFVNPDAVRHSIHADCYDDRFKEKNQYDKVRFVVDNYTPLSECFLYLHDDHFLLSHFRDVHWYDGSIYSKAEALHPEGIYRKTLVNTMQILGSGVCNYDVHAPIVMEKSIFKSLYKYDWNREFGYALKTMYVSQAGNGHHYALLEKDCKIKYPETKDKYLEMVKGREWFSNDNLAWDDDGEMKRFLESLYPNKSKWEK